MRNIYSLITRSSIIVKTRTRNELLLAIADVVFNWRSDVKYHPWTLLYNWYSREIKLHNSSDCIYSIRRMRSLHHWRSIASSWLLRRAKCENGCFVGGSLGSFLERKQSEHQHNMAAMRSSAGNCQLQLLMCASYDVAAVKGFSVKSLINWVAKKNAAKRGNYSNWM